MSKKTDEKAKRDALNDKLIDLMEKKRVYYKTLKDFQEVLILLIFIKSNKNILQMKIIKECKKNGLLLAKVQGN